MMKNQNAGVILFMSILSVFACSNNDSVALIGDGTYKVSIPKRFSYEKDEHGTLIIYNRKDDSITHRISFISFKKKDESEENPAAIIVEDSIKENGLPSFKLNNFLVAYWDENDETENLLMKYYKFGFSNNIFIMSSAVVKDKSFEKNSEKSVFEMRSLIGSIVQNKSFNKLEVGDKSIQFEKSTAENDNQNINQIDAQDSIIIENKRMLGNKIIQAYYIKEIDVKNLDLAFSLWIKDSKEFSDEDIINGIGLLFGDCLVKDLDMKWVKVTDKYGTDFAVYHKSNETLSYPLSSIAKRIDTKEIDFMWSIEQIVKDMINKKKI